MPHLASWFRRKPSSRPPAAESAARPAPATAAATAAPSDTRRGVLRRWRWPLTVVVVAFLAGTWALCWWWSREPAVFYVNDKTPDGRVVVGYSTVDTLTHVLEWL